MRASKELYDAWAELLVYPDEDGVSIARHGLDTLTSDDSTEIAHLSALTSFLDDLGPGEREELYTRTFDGSDDHALELGWHLHGENYARGAMLVRLRGLLRELKLLEGTELPDHLGVALGLLGRLDESRAGAIARGIVLPALRILEGNFKDEENPYVGVIRGVLRFLELQYEEQGVEV